MMFNFEIVGNFFFKPIYLVLLNKYMQYFISFGSEEILRYMAKYACIYISVFHIIFFTARKKKKNFNYNNIPSLFFYFVESKLNIYMYIRSYVINKNKSRRVLLTSFRIRRRRMNCMILTL